MFGAHLNNSPTLDGIFIADGTRLTKLVQVGDTFGGQAITAVGIDPKAFNDFGQTAYQAQFGDGSYKILLFTPPALNAEVVSRHAHGDTSFDINLPLTGAATVEGRIAAPAGTQTLVYKFPAPVTFTGATVASGEGSIVDCTGSGTTTVTVRMTGVSDAQTITVKLLSVSNGTSTMDIPVRMSLLAGDTNGDGVVNSGDLLRVRNHSGQPTDATNFHLDVNTDGVINSGDLIAVRLRSGRALPALPTGLAPSD